jgi:hypothetical protein
MPRKKLKKYLVFIWPQYEASGGANDFRESFFLLEEAEKYTQDFKFPLGDKPCGHITDRDTLEIVREF